MITTKGLIAEEHLTRKEIRETVPCGECVTTEWVDEVGDVVRRDVRIEVSKGALLGGRTGEN